MNDETGIVNTKVTDRLTELLDYVNHVGKLNQKQMFRLDEYNHLNIWEHQLKGQIGIQHNVTDSDGIPIWLRIERLKRILPPSIPEQIQEWITVSNDPENYPQIKDKLIKTLSEKKVEKLIGEGIVNESDVTNSLKHQMLEIQSKDVILRLDNNFEIKNDIDNYLNNQWLPWSEEENPRRETIKIYDSLFSLQQTIEAQGDEQPLELIWGIGIGRWLCEGHKIDHPLLEKPVEIEVNQIDSAILIHPRNTEPSLAIGAYSALDNPGVNTLFRRNTPQLAAWDKGLVTTSNVRELC